MEKNKWLNVGVVVNLEDVKKSTPRVVRALAPEEAENKKDTAHREWYPVFKLRGIRYVPHYFNPHFYVGPGFPKHTQKFFTAAQLTSLGAVMSQSFLLTRSNTKKVDELVGPTKKAVRRA